MGTKVRRLGGGGKRESRLVSGRAACIVFTCAGEDTKKRGTTLCICPSSVGQWFVQGFAAGQAGWPTLSGRRCRDVVCSRRAKATSTHVINQRVITG